MIIWEDSHFVVVHKPSGMPTTPTANGVASLASLFPGSHTVHRLDQRVSGLVLLAKNRESMTRATQMFQQGQIQKTYHAMVQQLPESQGTLIHWIKQDKNKAKLKNSPQDGYLRAELQYSVLASSSRYHVLEIQLKTGRFHQIRAQLSAVHAPIVGDIKYGYKRTTPDGSIYLQASKLEWEHPFTGEKIESSLPFPEVWARFGFTNPHTPVG